LNEFTTHYHRERNHLGLANALIGRPPAQQRVAPFVAGSDSAGF
jgi:hypothetical protein